MRSPLILVAILSACAAQGVSREDGWERIGMNDYAGAAVIFTRELEQGESADARAGLARALFLLGRLQQADAAYTEALLLEPTAQSYIGHSLVQLALGDPESAVLSCDRALEIEPALAKAWYDRGLAHVDSGRQSEALADFSRAIELDVRFGDAYNARGLVLARMERTDEALLDREWRRLKVLIPELPEEARAKISYAALDRILTAATRRPGPPDLGEGGSALPSPSPAIAAHTPETPSAI